MLTFDEMQRFHFEACCSGDRGLRPIRCSCGREFKTLRDMFLCDEGDHGTRQRESRAI
jgi:hypothetical protein